MCRILAAFVLAPLLAASSPAAVPAFVGHTETADTALGTRPEPPVDAIAEAKAAKFVESHGGKVERDEKQPGKPVVAVFFSGGKSFTKGNLDKPYLTDAGLKELAPLTRLTSLHLNGTEEVTEAGLRELGKLKNLTSLNLAGNEVTEAGIKELAKLKNLTSLNLVGSNVTREGLTELAKLENLTTLNLRGEFTDGWLKELRSFKKLNSLTLHFGFALSDSDELTPANLKKLVGLTSLTGLNLSASDVNDSGVKELAALKNLTSLWIKDTKVSAAGIAELQKALPNCKITK